MELKNLISFKTIADTKSFTKSALLLGYAQPTITFQIKQLEDELGVQLFDRIGNQIRLTASGHILLEYTLKILSLSAEVKNIIAKDSTPSGILHISGISSLCASILPPLIKIYNAKFPDVTISASTATRLQVLDMINNGSADIGLYMDFELPSDDIYTSFSMKNPLYFICSPNNNLHTQKSLTIKNLAGIPLIATEPQCRYRKLLTNLFIKNNITPSIMFESENTEVIKRFVQSDLGISFLPEIAVREELKTGKLCKINITDAIPSVYINVIHKNNQWITPAIREFFNLF